MKQQIVFILLFLAVSAINYRANAQKNSIELTEEGSYFFTKSPYKYSTFRAAPFPYLTYRRSLKKIDLALQLGYSFIDYFPTGGNKTPVLYDVLYKEFFILNLYAGKKGFFKNHKGLKMYGGLSYLFGGDYVHYGFNNHGSWSEELVDTERYGLGLGFSGMAQQKITIWKNLYFNAQVSGNFYPLTTRLRAMVQTNIGLGINW